MAEKLSKFAVHVLRRIALKSELPLRPDGGLYIGARPVPRSVIDRLLGGDLVERDGEVVRLSPAGGAYLRRLDAGRTAKSEKVQGAASSVDTYRRQHMSLAREKRQMEDGRAQLCLVNGAESPLGWLLRRRGKDGKSRISIDQFQAGERLREAFECAGLNPKLTAAYDGLPVSGGRRAQGGAMMESDRQLDARRRVHAALDAVGPDLADILVRVCCFHEGLGEAEKTLGWPTRSGKLVLSIALDRLVDFYQGRLGDMSLARASKK